MLSESHLRDALRACFDPQLGLNIVDLGLVHSIDLALDTDAPGSGIPGVPPRQKLNLMLLKATEDEAQQGQLVALIASRIAGLPEISHATVAFTDNPAWSPSLITPEGRRALKLDQPHFTILNNRVR